MSQGIIVVGLGPGDPGHLTVEAMQVLSEASDYPLISHSTPSIISTRRLRLSRKSTRVLPGACWN